MRFIKNLSLAVMILLTMTSFAQNLRNVRQVGRQAFAAKTEAECNALLPVCRKFLETVPNHPVMHYLIARLNALSGRKEEAFTHLRIATTHGYGLNMLGYKLDISNDPAFDSLRQTAKFKAIEDKVREIEKPVENSRMGFTIPDKELLPEGIAYDPVKEVFYLGSETKKKIVRFDKKGNVSDFVSPNPDGLEMVLGMEVDVQRRFLWVCTVFHDGQPYRALKTEKGWTGVFKYDIESGKLIKKYIIPQINERHEFNDLVVNSRGDVYISDSQYGAIYIITHHLDELALFLKSDQFASPNGITLSNDETKIYLADWIFGIHRVDLDTRNVTFLKEVQGISASGIDGLYFFNQSLIAVQNGFDRVVRFFLNEAGDEIIKMNILDANISMMDNPTTGVIVSNHIYYIANRSMRNYHKRKNLTDTEIKDVTVLKIKLVN